MNSILLPDLKKVEELLILPCPDKPQPILAKRGDSLQRLFGNACLLAKRLKLIARTLY
jgi:hypothetical protein